MTNPTDHGAAGVAQMRAVTISREYGSGGGEIAARLAARLGWRLIDHEVVEQVAAALGVSEAEAAAHDEHVDSPVWQLLSSLAITPSPIPAVVSQSLTIDSSTYDATRRRVVSAAAQAGHVVIVGRGAQVLLADQCDVLHVRIVAPLDARIAYVMRRENFDQAAAQSRIQLKDRDRLHFLTTVHHRTPEDAHLYDLVVNTGVIDLDGVVDLLVGALERKARQLAIPAEELGPGAGLARYPAPPGDFNAAGDGGRKTTGQ